MAELIGADPNELRSLAAQMRSAADELDGHSSGLTSLLGSVEWVGDFASQFVSGWSGGHRVRLQSTSQFIREAARELERNADEQSGASDSGGGFGRSGAGRAGSDSTGAGMPSGLSDADAFDSAIDDLLGLGSSILDGADVLQGLAGVTGLAGTVVPGISLGLGLYETYGEYQEHGWASKEFVNSAVDTTVSGVLSFTPVGPFWAGGNLVSEFLTGQSIVDNAFDDPISTAMVFCPPTFPLYPIVSSIGLNNLIENADNSPWKWVSGEFSDFVGS